MHCCLFPTLDTSRGYLSIELIYTEQGTLNILKGKKGHQL